MKPNKLYFASVICLVISCRSVSQNSILIVDEQGKPFSDLIKSKDFTGYIFGEKHFVSLTIDNQSKRYTPSEEDVF